MADKDDKKLQNTLKNQLRKKSGTKQLEALRKKLLEKAANLNKAVKKADSVIEKDRIMVERVKLQEKARKLNIPDSLPGILG